MSSLCRLRVEGLSKSFFGVRVLHEVSFEVAAGEVLGFVGENGSGKSTTMNILAGVLPRDSGSISLDGVPFGARSRREADGAGVAFIQQELTIFPELTIAENLFLCRFPRWHPLAPIISRNKMRDHARELLRAVDLQIEPDVPAGTLSPGERQLVEIARALASDARLIIFDEPTTSLTERETARLFEIIARLRGRAVSVIYISHALEEVRRLCDRIVVMRDGRITRCVPSAATTTQELVVAMVGRSISTLFPERPASASPAAAVLQVENLSQPGVLDAVSFSVRKGEIVGLAGLMGSGRTELARTIFGLDPHQAGSVRVGGRVLASGDLAARIAVGMAFLTEDRRHEGLMMEASVADNMALAALPLFVSGADRRIDRKRLTEAMHALVKQLQLRSADLERAAVGTLSGGNQQKVVLGRWLLRQPSLFILDEPTRGVDVGAKEEIYRILAELAASGMGIVVISSELEELIGLTDRILVMHRGRLCREFQRAHFDREAILQAAFGEGEAA